MGYNRSQDDDEDGSSSSSKSNSKTPHKHGGAKAIQSYSIWNTIYNRAFNALSAKKMEDVDQGFNTTEQGEVLKHGESLRNEGLKNQGPKNTSQPKPRPAGFGGSSRSSDSEDDDSSSW